MKRISVLIFSLNRCSKAVLQNTPLTKYFHLRRDVVDHLYKVRQWIFQTSIKYCIFLNAVLLPGVSIEGTYTKFQGNPLWISGNLNVLFKAEKQRSMKTFWLRCIFCFVVIVNKNNCKFASPENKDDGKMQAKADRWIMGELIKLISRSTKNKMDV